MAADLDNLREKLDKWRRQEALPVFNEGGGRKSYAPL